MKRGTSHFRRAAHAGDLELTMDLLRDNICIDAPQEDGCTALWLACEKGHNTVVRALCEHGADVNITKHAGRVSPLYIAAQNGHLAVVRTLLLYSVSIDQTKSTGTTPLFIAAQQNHYDIVRALLEAGADVEHRNHMGITPLMIAAYQGNATTVHLLLRYGADPHAMGGGRNTFEWAECGGHSEKLRDVFEAYQSGKIHHSDYDDAITERTLITHASGCKGQRRKEVFQLSACPNAFGLATPPEKTSIMDVSGRPMSLFPPRYTLVESSLGKGQTFTTYTRDPKKDISKLVAATCVTRELIKLEQSRQKSFHSSILQHRRTEDQPATTSAEGRIREAIMNPSEALLLPGSLNRNTNAVEREWASYKGILATRESMMADGAYDLPDDWMYSVGHCEAFVNNTNKFRKEEYIRMQKEKQNKTTVQDPTLPEGVVIPPLDPNRMRDFRCFLNKGVGAKQPPTATTC